MSRRVISTAGVTLVALLALAPASLAKPRKSYCSPSGDYCTAIKGKPGSPRFSIGSFAFDGAYTLCVTAPDTSRACQDYRLRRDKHGINTSRVPWRGNYPDLGPGRYFVTFSLQGSTRLGPRLSFVIG